MEPNKKNTKFSFTEAYDNEVTPERIKKLNQEVNKFENPEQKIAFLEKRKLEYLQNIPSSIFEASGCAYLPNFEKGESLFFDRIIEIEIEKLKLELKPELADTKTDKLKAELGKYGFFELLKVKQLSEPNKQSLIELISTNDLPYSIAMVEYLGFIKHLRAEHFTTDSKLFKAVANWFVVAERAVKGNIYVLSKFSKENRKRYTADQQKQTVQKNYEALK